MSLHQLPESAPSQSRRSLLPASLVLSMSLVLAACNKSSTSAEVSTASPTEVQKLEIPSSVIGAMPEHSTRAERQKMLADITRLALGKQDPRQAPYIREFPFDASRGDQWQLCHVIIGFGPDAGIKMIMQKKHITTEFRWEMTDIFNSGDIVFSEKRETTPLRSVEGTPMIRMTQECQIDDGTQAMYAAGLNTLKNILEVESQSEK